jgi:hypothetical protein
MPGFTSGIHVFVVVKSRVAGTSGHDAGRYLVGTGLSPR